METVGERNDANPAELVRKQALEHASYVCLQRDLRRCHLYRTRMKYKNSQAKRALRTKMQWLTQASAETRKIKSDGRRQRPGQAEPALRTLWRPPDNFQS